MPKTTYLDNNYLNLSLRATPFVPPATVYVGLYTVAPTAAGGGTEVTGGGYARQAVTFGAPVDGQVSSTADANFPVATLDWGTIVAFGIFDDVAAGHLLYFNNLSASRQVLTNDQIRFPAGQLICSEA